MIYRNVYAYVSKTLQCSAVIWVKRESFKNKKLAAEAAKIPEEGSIFLGTVEGDLPLMVEVIQAKD